MIQETGTYVGSEKVNYRIWNILVGKKKTCQVINKERKLVTEPACDGEN